jgi:hypothetical protein
VWAFDRPNVRPFDGGTMKNSAKSPAPAVTDDGHTIVFDGPASSRRATLTGFGWTGVPGAPPSPKVDWGSATWDIHTMFPFRCVVQSVKAGGEIGSVQVDSAGNHLEKQVR